MNIKNNITKVCHEECVIDCVRHPLNLGVQEKPHLIAKHNDHDSVLECS